MKIAYLNKQLPFGVTDSFILPEVAEHLAHGWDVWLVPVEDGPLLHDPGLLDRTIGAPVISPAILGGALLEFCAHPLRTVSLMLRMLRAPSAALCLRNLAVLPKGLWLGRKLLRDGFEHIHIHYAAAPATMGVVAAHVSGLPYSLTAHRYDIAQNNLLDWKALGAQFVRAIDEPGAQEIRKYVADSRLDLVVLHMGVAVPEQIAPVRSDPVFPFRMAVAARLAGKKGHRYILDAMAIARNRGVECELEVFGDGPLASELSAQADRLGIAGNITWHGATVHAVLLMALMSGRFDAGILPSITTEDGDKEGIPVFLIEAMAAGLPVITTANGGIVELAGNGKGAIVPERDADALADAIVTLASDEAERRRMAKAGRAHVIAEFEVTRCMARLRALVAQTPNDCKARQMGLSEGGTSSYQHNFATADSE